MLLPRLLHIVEVEQSFQVLCVSDDDIFLCLVALKQQTVEFRVGSRGGILQTIDQKIIGGHMKDISNFDNGVRIRNMFSELNEAEMLP